LGKFQKLKRLG